MQCQSPAHSTYGSYPDLAVYRVTFTGGSRRGVPQPDERLYYCAGCADALDVGANDRVLGCVHRDYNAPNFRWTEEELIA